MTAQPGQTLLDIALMGAGTIESLFDIISANGGSITDDPVTGATYIIPVISNTDVVQYLQQQSVFIGTKEDTRSASTAGIGFMIVGSTFTVS